MREGKRGHKGNGQWTLCLCSVFRFIKRCDTWHCLGQAPFNNPQTPASVCSCVLHYVSVLFYGDAALLVFWHVAFLSLAARCPVTALKKLPFMRNRSKEKDRVKAVYRRSMCKTSGKNIPFTFSVKFVLSFRNAYGCSNISYQQNTNPLELCFVLSTGICRGFTNARIPFPCQMKGLSEGLMRF